MASQVMAIALSVAPLASSSSMTAAAVETSPVIRTAAAAASKNSADISLSLADMEFSIHTRERSKQFDYGGTSDTTHASACIVLPVTIRVLRTRGAVKEEENW